MTTQRTLKKAGKVYIISFDDENMLDTVECNGVLLSTKNKVVKSIMTHADSILVGIVPKGFKKA